MAVTKAKKIEHVEALAVELKSVKNGFVTEFGKLTVAQDDELRTPHPRRRRKYRVVKNTLAERAAKGTAFGSVIKDLDRTHLGRLHRRRPGGAGQGADQVRQR